MPGLTFLAMNAHNESVAIGGLLGFALGLVIIAAMEIHDRRRK